MTMQLIKRSTLVLGAAAIFCSVPAFAATITPAGGTLTNMTPATIAAAYGDFGATQQVWVNLDFPPVLTNMTLGRLSGSYSSDSIQLSGYATSAFDEIESAYRTGSVVGQIGFTLSDDSATQFSLSQSFGNNWNLLQSVTLTLRDASNQVKLGCIGRGDFNIIGGGCKVGSQPTAGDFTEMPLQGELVLAGGYYELSFVASGSVLSGAISSPTDFDFSLNTVPAMSAVPLPASAWLLASGLGLLARRRRAAKAH